MAFHDLVTENTCRAVRGSRGSTGGGSGGSDSDLTSFERLPGWPSFEELLPNAQPISIVKLTKLT